MTMPAEDLARWLRAALDAVEVPERPWPAVRLQLIRRGRRRRLQGAAVLVVLAVTAIAVTLVMVLPAHGKGHRPVVVRSTPPPAVRSIPLGGVVSGLRQPGALAVGPDGQLYVADDGRNQVLQLVRGGKFRVVAGNGKRGFSGDGRRADSASLNDPGGLVVTRSGTLYIADTGNNRIRAVWPSGIISTVAGDGLRHGAWVSSGTPALAASLLSPSDVAIGPHGALYIADTGYSEILKLAAPGRLIRVAGTRRFAGVWGIRRPAPEASADGPDGLAFDRAGNLYIAGSNTKTLLMITSGGIMRLPDGTDGFYPDVEFLAERLGVHDGQHRVADVLVQPRRVARGRHRADLVAAQEHREHVDHLVVDVGAGRGPPISMPTSLRRGPSALMRRRACLPTKSASWPRSTIQP
jgi:hypothetical protein